MPRTDAITRLTPAQAAAQLLAAADETWTRQFLQELEHRVRADQLRHVMTRWRLSGGDVARIFRVSRQAVAKWLASSPPAEREPQVADLVAATEVLERYVRRERIAAVVRRPAPALGGHSLLQLAQQGRTAEVLDAVRTMVDLRRVQP